VPIMGYNNDDAMAMLGLDGDDNDGIVAMCGTCDVMEPSTMDSEFEHDAQSEGADITDTYVGRPEIVEN
jgi:hypothetical protein